MVKISEKDFKILKKELAQAFDGLIEYAYELEDTWVCEKHLHKIEEILNKYKVEKAEE
jgi:sulfur relay (sulfurtransferase) DsrF/TusC family protein